MTSKHRTNTIDTSATSKQVRETTDRELTEEQLAQITGGGDDWEAPGGSFLAKGGFWGKRAP
jgi:bacteriocin-like protein